MTKLKHVPSFDGAFSYDGETYPMDDGVFVVEDSDVAETIVEDYTKVSFAGDEVDETPTPDADTSEDICGTEMSDGSICERDADSCPYHE